MGSLSFAPSLYQVFGASVCKLSFSGRVPVKKRGQGGGIADGSQVVAMFSFSISHLLCIRYAPGYAGMVENNTLLASRCLKRELVSSKKLS